MFQSWIFFFTEVEYCCLAICSVIRLSSFYVVTEVINVRLEWNFLVPRFHTSPDGWPAWQWLPPSDVVWFTLLFLLFYLGYIFSQENEKQNLRVNFVSDRNLEGTQNKKYIFLTMAERTISKFVSTRSEVKIIVTKNKNRQQRMMSVFASWTAKSMEKRDWMFCQKYSIWYHAICVGAKGKRQFIYGKWHWSELYQLIEILLTEVHFRSIVRSFLVF